MYKITNPDRLKDLKIYRYNVLNEHFNFKSPMTTPQLYIFDKGNSKLVDINREENFLDPKEMLRKIV
jgi:hypothetical protein